MAKDNELRWNLGDIVKPDEWKTLYKKTESALSRFGEFYGTMAPDMSTGAFREFMEFDQSITENIYMLFYQADLMLSADQTSGDARLLKQRAEELDIKYDDASRSILQWMKGKSVEGKLLLDDDKDAARLFASVPDLEYFLQHMREGGVHTLTEGEERIIIRKDTTGVNALRELRTLKETNLNYRFKPEGAKRARIFKTKSDILAYIRSGNAAERKAAYIGMLGEYQRNLDEFFIIFKNVVRDWNHEAELRGYTSPISRRNFSNHVPGEAIATLLEVCSKNSGVFQDYFKWKAHELGMGKLRRFDIFAPLEQGEEKEISFAEAIELVLGTFKDFSPGFAEKARMVVEAGHIDSHPRPGKIGGAFCVTVAPGIIPYVLTNHTGRLSGTYTAAHELGHAAHSLYASHHSINSQRAVLPLSETASTLGEMIVFEKCFAEAPDEKTRKSMLSDKIAEAYASIMRQSYFVIFENRAHEAIMEGVTAEKLSDIYFETLQEQFGDSVDIDPIFKYEWAYITQIVNTPFYCYAYNFGDLLSMALFAQYREQGEAFVPKIEKILAYGGSKNPQEILQEVGIDMCSGKFWQGSFDILGGWMDQLKGYQ